MSGNLKDFIEFALKYDSVDSILDTQEEQSMKGMMFESLWDLCIKLGFCGTFPKSIYINKIGNSNGGRLKDLKDLDRYLEKNGINRGNSAGSSDITLYNTQDDSYVFISSKYPKEQDDMKKQKSVAYYDIQHIVSMADDNKELYRNYTIFLLVPDKHKVMEKIKKSSKTSNYITKHMNNILDKSDLQECFILLKRDMTNKPAIKDISFNEIYLMEREQLQLRFHQELITEKTSELIEEGQKSFLWGVQMQKRKNIYDWRNY